MTDHLRYYLSTVGKFELGEVKTGEEKKNSGLPIVGGLADSNYWWEFKGIAFQFVDDADDVDDPVIQDHWKYLSMSRASRHDVNGGWKTTYETEFYFIFSTFCELLNRIQGRKKWEGEFLDKWEGDAVNNLGNKR